MLWLAKVTGPIPSIQPEAVSKTSRAAVSRVRVRRGFHERPVDVRAAERGARGGGPGRFPAGGRGGGGGGGGGVRRPRGGVGARGRGRQGWRPWTFPRSRTAQRERAQEAAVFETASKKLAQRVPHRQAGGQESMKVVQLQTQEPVTTEISVQPASLDIWDKKYRLKSKTGEVIDADIAGTYARVARALADVEEIPEKRGEWFEKFFWALQNGAIPAGRIISNAGALEHKPATSTINCTVSRIIPDSMDGILRAVHEAGLTLKAGCGAGYEFSTLRPKGAFVSGAGAYTSGPLSFMDIFDAMCFTVSSAGGRRGAQMGTFDIAHPDIMDFIKAKREDGRLRQFNLSCLITDEFMQAVKKNGSWDLLFPVSRHEYENPESRIVWRYWPVTEGYITNNLGQVACKIYKSLPARRLWDLIMASTYDYAEPGFILIDKINEMNNNWFCENIRATNPCVTADTWVQTAAGPRQVRELIGTSFLARVDG